MIKAQLSLDFDRVEEVYKDVVGFEGLYKVSNEGRVWSIRNKIFMKFDLDKNKYQMITLCKNGKRYRDKVHRLVFFTFNPNVDKCFQINHKNRVKQDNNLSNLEAVTVRENNTHRCLNVKKSSRFTGANFEKKSNKWKATIITNQKSKFLGYFNCETAAHFAYLKELKNQNIKNKYA